MPRNKQKKQITNPVESSKGNVSSIFEDKNLYALASILLLTLLAYSPILKNGFVNWDDDTYLLNNSFIQSFNFKYIFGTYVVGNYHPLTMLGYTIEHYFFGLNAKGYHVVSLFLHLINVILVYYAVRLFSKKGEIALIATVLFALHPIHVESVAWASELKDLLYTLFFLTAFILYLKYVQEANRKLYFLALLFFLFSLLSKAMAASFPLILLLADYFTGRKITRKVILEKLPFLLLSIVFGIVALKAQKSFNYLHDDSFYTFPQRLVFACYGIIGYIYKLIAPFNFSAFYPYPIKSGQALPWIYFVYPILVAGLIGFTIFTLKKTKKIVFGLAFFSITVALVLQIISVGDAVMADRYAYIPSIGIFYLAGEGFYWLRTHNFKTHALVILSVFLIFCSTQTYAACKVWKNGMTLWNSVIEQYQTVPIAYNNRGNLYYDAQRYPEAFSDYSKAIELNPLHTTAYNNLGNILKIEKKYPEALANYNKALKLNPEYTEVYFNRALLNESMGDTKNAVRDYSKIIQLNPTFSAAYQYRGAIYQNSMRFDEALLDYKKAIELSPSNAMVYYNRAMIYSYQKNYPAAIADFSKSIQLDPNNAVAYYKRGKAHYYAGEKDKACSDFGIASNRSYAITNAEMAKVCQ